MGMQITKGFVVRAPADAVWQFLTDPYRVASCLPGAAITGKTDERTYTGTITVKVGPVATSYRGTVTFERLDPRTGSAEIAASGQDVRGKGGAEMRMTSMLVARSPRETEVTVNSEVNVSGLLAQLGRGMIQDVSDQLFQKFTTAMSAALEGAGSAAPAAPTAPAAEPIQAVSFGAGVVGRAAARAARRPATWVVVAVLIIVVWLFIRRLS